MTYQIYLGDYSYSSWSLRGWLLLHRWNLPYHVTFVDFSDGSVAAQVANVVPARTVPTLVTPEGTVVWDSLAMAEELASRHPDVGIWPADPAARATARSLAAEMHSGFGALRNACPMNLRAAYADYAPSAEVLADISRIEAIWSLARARHGGQGPWLCGSYSAADAFFAPVAMRIAGYGLPVSAQAQAYVEAHLNDPALRRWRAMGLVRGDDLPQYARGYARKPWPGPAPLMAEATEDSTAENATCPYSHDPVAHFLKLDGRIFGFCNAFCRDKTAADPAAWPAFMALLGNK
ncbi:glutathione S-transferase [Puniceibacterium sediminis]|uniref:Glutathione S-transferase n=1 Tax=Puniceibacterium sediminis TaxID=1608407 RepID=A0A238WQ20_9RHOB|nr:glutathione S-transferase [Puniceibacterium sediminis]SNR47769.1 glutathione S-transferase [Puniceibacterium sediminis]